MSQTSRALGFFPTPTFESLGPLYIKEGEVETTKILVDSTTLKASASGSIASQDLIQGLSSDNQGQQGGGHSTSSQRFQQNQPSARRSDGYSNSAAIYSSFISAVTGSLSLLLVRQHGALPLGSRTLFTPIDKIGYESPRIDNESVLSTSYLTTLNVQLHATGTLTVFPTTVSQVGITRLCSPRDDISDVLRVQPGTDLWLCPNGAISRLVTANIESPTVPSPGFSTSGDLAAKRMQWKLDVLRWLANFGLHIESIDEEPWVEVEVWEPFFARLAGEAWRQSDEPQSVLPLKRMLWPARFCFKRYGSSIQSSSLENALGDPLKFAESWSSNVSSLAESNHDTRGVPVLEEPQPKDNDMSSPKFDSLENFESLSRMAQYPDLQNTNLVYPTPPDGATSMTMNNLVPSDAYPEDPDFNLSPAILAEQKSLPNLELAVGTGRYDASDDEDLFGEMNDKDFGSKGITDADFSFFDDPTLDDMLDDTPANHIQEPAKAPLSSNMDEQADSGDLDLSESTPLGLTSVDDIVKEETPSSQTPKILANVTEEQMQTQDTLQLSSDPSIQTVSPPLSPVEIKKILFSGSQRQKDEHFGQVGSHQGHYHPVTFEKKVVDWDQKYGSQGKFWFSDRPTGNPTDDTSSFIPTIGVPNRGRTRGSAPIFTPSALPNPSAVAAGSCERSSSVSSSGSSDASDDAHLEQSSTSISLPTLKRKRVFSESDIQSATSPAKSSIAVEGSAGLKIENTTFLGNFFANFSDWSFTGYFSALQIQQLPVLFRREDQISIAQLLVDQITQSSLDHSLGGQIKLFGLETENLTLQNCFDDATFLGDISKLDLRGYTTLYEDTTSSLQQTKDCTGRGLISKVSAPHLRVRRGKEYLEALPPAVSFWETFGLEPAHGSKDISAYCIHPPSAVDAADSFLNRFGILYQSCNLGKHTRGDKSTSFTKGLRSWNSESTGYTSMMQSLKGICEELANALSQSASTTDNCVVYIINPFPHAAALADICVAFWCLFKELAASSERGQSKEVKEVALQIIPMDFIISGESMVVPAQTDYLNLALEVYHRCRPKDENSDPLFCAPAILLADPLPKSISFRLNAEKGCPLQDGRTLHIACSKSSDQRWISAAWSDGTGNLQTSLSYCLRYRHRGTIRTITEVRNEIWATTKRIMEKFQARWKVVLVNTDPIDLDEVECWNNLAEQQNKIRPGSLELNIVTVNCIPDLILQSLASPMAASVLNPHFSSTPVSTPNPSASVASPEQSGNAPTPSAVYNASTPTEPSLEPDSDVVLVDVCDESWTVILSHRLSISPHITELRPALSSGYLLRRKGAADSDGVFTMNANLIYTQRPSSSPESVLKEILGMYRDLACLARAKGIRSVQANTLPWHIATALRAQELLSYVF
ncbi:Mediator complex subunit Med13 [Penicillium macrosclerotiorum]|uniref:Mediator complex subunit Med13 n=1 Tax=Penicillium macrosclerotiorum TaxID=303699 RepID=UPI0025485D3C|nr:Mediator complex subunit Med13 [Penicillium macrosclerotiorum]KAJ5669571.1 Mediator complex subunit Med13 [Penicillium macrosclerotiorum]